MTKITFRLPKELAQRARIDAIKQEVSLQELIVEALAAHLRKRGGAR